MLPMLSFLLSQIFGLRRHCRWGFCVCAQAIPAAVVTVFAQSRRSFWAEVSKAISGMVWVEETSTGTPDLASGALEVVRS